jgi:CheY-like chemotaxis protein
MRGRTVRSEVENPLGLPGTPRQPVALIVDPDEGTRVLAADIIRKIGNATLLAEDAEQALEQAAAVEGELTLLVTAVVLRGASGLELAARLKMSFPRLRVLYISAPADSVRVLGEVHPASASLRKPFTREELAYKLGVLCGDAYGLVS